MDITSYLLGKKSGGGGGSLTHDWTAIGYTGEPQEISDGYDYAVQLKNNWDSTQTNLSNKYASNPYLIFMPLVDTSQATDMSSMFKRCHIIKCPLLNTSNVTTMANMFQESDIISVPLFDTSNVTDMSYMFNADYDLINLPQLNTSKVKNMNSMFSQCSNLSDESLDNILKMCIGASPEYSKTKTLSAMGFTNGNQPKTKIQALPSYNDFITAGWTIGY